MSAQILNYMPPIDAILIRLSMSVDLLREVPLAKLSEVFVIHEDTGLELTSYQAIRHLEAMLGNIADKMIIERSRNELQA